MEQALAGLLGAASVVPHGHPVPSRPDLAALHAISDVAMALAYVSIPVAVLVFLHKRSDLKHNMAGALLAVFTLGWAVTPVTDLASLWWPNHGIEDLVKPATALLSVLTVVAVWRLWPGALRRPTTAQLRRANAELQAEIARRTEAEAALARTLEGLEAQVAARTRELGEANEQLRSEVVERARAEEASLNGETRLAAAGERLRLAVEATKLGIWDIDVRTGHRQWTDELKAILGFSLDTVEDVGMFVARIHPDDRDWVEEARRQADDPANGGRFHAQFRILRADDGSERWVESNGRVHFDELGTPMRAIGTLADITERRRTELALQARTAELETVLETVPVAVWLAHDPQASRITGNLTAVNQLRLAASDNLSLGAPETERPRHFQILRDGSQVRPERLPLQRAARGEVVRNEELRILFDDGTYYDEVISAMPVRDGTGKVIGAVGAAMDITERKAAEERIRHLALHDPLTGLPNRALFQDRLNAAILRAKRADGQVAVMLLDVDHFKEINDTLGHLAGDSVLRQVASRLRTSARASDTWARLGGDEFALVLEGVQSAEGVAIMAARALNALSEPFQLDGQPIEIAASVGAALYPTDGESPEVLVRNADRALYCAKTAGRDRFEPYRTALDRELHRTSRMQRELRRALDREAFELVYQPIFTLPSQRLAKTEALLRLRQEDGSCVPPADIVAHAESSGLIHRLGEWVLRTACRQGGQWHAEGHAIRMAVNVSAAQLRSSEFPLLLSGILAQTGLPPDRLELEITESVFLDYSKGRIREALHEIAAMGVTLAIDDFGRGYSSLAYLRTFPFHEIKIDRLFVADATLSAEGAAITAAIIGLARSLGKRVTAEGVETQEQLDFLRERGCDAAQGYLLARPGPASRILDVRRAAA